MGNHWEKYHSRWNQLEAPLRPLPETVGVIEREGRTADRDVLLLGVTPELTGLGRALVAVDASTQMIAALWQGEGPARQAVAGNWAALPIADRSMDAVVGDGSLNAVDRSAARQAVMREAARVLRPGGRLAIRVFASPAGQDDLAEIRQQALSGAIGNFHALKWKLAMAQAGPDPDRSVEVSAIRDATNELFPDRMVLAASTGWALSSIDTIDAYAGSQVAYSFPTAAQLVSEATGVFGNVRLACSGTYPLSERCPILVAELTPV